MVKLTRKYKLSGSFNDDDAMHSPSLHANQAIDNDTDRVVAPTYIQVPVGDPVPQYSATVVGESTEYNPSGNCNGNFMSYKFQVNNNCYNYSTNVATNSFAQPGRMTGKPLQKGWTGQDVVDGAVSDGLIYLGNSDFTQEDIQKQVAEMDGHIVALMISTPDAAVDWPGDYHWARMDDIDTLQWSQKDGGDQVTNFDFAGHSIVGPIFTGTKTPPIGGPRVANWTVNQGPMIKGSEDDVVVSYEFFAYMFVPASGIKII
ncbi:hypothetical protein [Colwellia psychrerythraea]|uniref:Uncharacterized protein n=1 Tax=Colwellia psychrerythraea TaxID=28229 RepID=A0A099KYF1_COLPS|nr:hypothetical protein [Colwellia psychrerythraea]KGJ94902.1 hypothetical protein GAB14E_2136 [Colwellia psychrerythraea]